MGVKDKMIGEKSEMLEMVTRICRGYLHGPWKKITVNDIILKRISGGLSNWLYHVKLQNENAEPSQVLLRFYGQSHGEHAIESVITESVIFTLLSERKLGPKLHGIFPGGRIEEYVPARPLKTFEMSDPELSLMIADKMAAIHTMNIPINKEPCWLWNTINRWLQTIEESQFNTKVQNCIQERLYKYDLRSEVKWLRNHLQKIRSPVVFCHNDMQEGNLLLKEDAVKDIDIDNDSIDNGDGLMVNNTNERSITVIDFEYCSYNYRGFDLANHFIEFLYDYTKVDHPNFSVHKDHYPTRDQMLTFINRYLSHSDSVGSVPASSDLNTPEHLLTEVKHFSLASHLFWGLWGIVNAQTSQIPFGYWEYAAERLDSYYLLKSQLVGKEVGVKRKAKDLD